MERGEPLVNREARTRFPAVADQGGEHWLYRYKKYTDVRLVFAPEMDIAFFGGDPDNFEYPRYDLDICFFRVYEDGKPAKTPDHLAWSPAGVRDGELVFAEASPAGFRESARFRAIPMTAAEMAARFCSSARRRANARMAPR